MITAGQVMTKDVVTIAPEAPVLDVVRLLADHEVSGLPVVDRDRHLRGIVTEKDVMRLLVEEDLKKRNVSDYMTHKVVSFKEASSIAEICKFFMKNNVRRVPILNDENKLVGIVSRRDVLREIRRIKGI